MSVIDYRNSSPYFNTPQTSWYLGVLEYRDIPRDGSDRIRILESKYDTRPDLLSYELYGTPNYWWVFMILNPNTIKDPIYDFKAGISIYVPTSNRLSTILGS